jgi:hypothetical protein
MAETPDGKTAFVLGQLRHAYAHLVAGTVGDHKAFADGLIAPAIRAMESAPAPDLSALWALVDQWHADAKVMREIAHFRDDPYDDVAFVNRNEANRLIACACALAALLPPRAEGQQGAAGR